MVPRIEDYAMIGDCRTAAIISRAGSVDWLCFPRFDSDACFAALLGSRDNGCWSINPLEPFTTTRKYCGESLILETIFKTRTGKVRLIDFMPPNTPHTTLVRIVQGLEGRVKLRTELAIRFDYGVTIPWVTRRDRKTLTAVAGRHLLAIRTPVKMAGRNMHT